MRHRQIYEVPTDKRIIIKLPQTFNNKKKILVILDDSVDIQTQKLEQLRKAPNDPLFMTDMKEVEKDFSSIDSETL
ncbi:MAG TPA: hypothetical protein ENI76_03665 [Ignavibacteria bacterium]|nr:hypothetical protein [Ignavibacteria bacterium]